MRGHGYTRALGLVLALLAVLGVAVAPPVAAEPRSRSRYRDVAGRRAEPNTIVLSLPFSSSGPVLADDANTVVHATWNGTALSDSYGNSWTKVGTPAQVTASPFYPSGFSGSARAGSGPYANGDYYKLGTGSDVMDFAGDFSACFLFRNLGEDANGKVFSDGAYEAGGYYLQVGTNADMYAVFSGSGTSSVLTHTGGIGLMTFNLWCIGRSGNNFYSKLNGGTTQTSTFATYTAATAKIATIGNYSDLGYPLYGEMYEVWATTTAWDETTMAGVQRRVLGLVADTGQAVTVTRASTATYEAGSRVWTAPSGVGRVTADGLLVGSAATNLLLRSEALDNAAWTSFSSISITADQAVGPDGLTRMELVDTTSGFADGSRYQGVTTASSSGAYTASAWVSPYGGASTNVWVAGGCNTGTNATSCSCRRSDGGAVTATASSHNCQCQLTLAGDAGLVRVDSTNSCASAVTTRYLSVGPGVNAVSTGRAYIGYGQIESGDQSSAYIPTAGTSATRAADAVSVASGLGAGNLTPCLHVQAKPYGGRSWSAATVNLLSLGTVAGADSLRLHATTGGDLVVTVTDGSSGTKTATYTHGFSAGSSHALTACVDPAGGAPVLWVDGAAVSATGAGAGTGLLASVPATLYLGPTGGGATEWGGYFKSVRVSWSPEPRRLQ